MKNPFLNSTEVFGKAFQQQAEMGTKFMSAVIENMNEQMSVMMETNRKIAELVTNQMNATTKSQMNLWHELSNLFNKQVEIISDNVNTAQKEAEKIVKKSANVSSN